LSRSDLRTGYSLAAALGYGKNDVTDCSIAQLDDIEKKTEGGKSQRGLFNRIDYSLKNFKFSA